MSLNLNNNFGCSSHHQRFHTNARRQPGYCRHTTDLAAQKTLPNVKQYIGSNPSLRQRQMMRHRENIASLLEILQLTKNNPSLLTPYIKKELAKYGLDNPETCAKALKNPDAFSKAFLSKKPSRSPSIHSPSLASTTSVDSNSSQPSKSPLSLVSDDSETISSPIIVSEIPSPSVAVSSSFNDSSQSFESYPVPEVEKLEPADNSFAEAVIVVPSLEAPKTDPEDDFFAQYLEPSSPFSQVSIDSLEAAEKEEEILPSEAELAEYLALQEKMLKTYALFLQRISDNYPILIQDSEMEDPVSQGLDTYANEAIDAEIQRQTCFDEAVIRHKSDFHVVRDRLKHNLKAAESYKKEIVDLLPEPQKEKALDLLPILDEARGDLISPRYRGDRKSRFAYPQNSDLSEEQRTSLREKAKSLSKEEIAERSKKYQDHFKALDASCMILNDKPLENPLVKNTIAYAKEAGFMPQASIAALHESYVQQLPIEKEYFLLGDECSAIFNQSGRVSSMESRFQEEIRNACATVRNSLLPSASIDHVAAGKIGEALRKLERLI